LRQLNPLAKVVFGNQNAFPVIGKIERDGELDAIFDQSKHPSDTNFPVQKPHHHHHHEHTKVVSHTIVFDQPFEEQKLRHRKDIQRKGLEKMLRQCLAALETRSNSTA